MVDDDREELARWQATEDRNQAIWRKLDELTRIAHATARS
jgi:ferric-dicitrate binding protein FerR (iron transport regulator)